MTTQAATASKTSQPGPLPSLRRPSSSGLGATAADSASAAAMKQWEKERAALLAAKIGAEEVRGDHLLLVISAVPPWSNLPLCSSPLGTQQITALRKVPAVYCRIAKKQ